LVVTNLDDAGRDADIKVHFKDYGPKRKEFSIEDRCRDRVGPRNVCRVLRLRHVPRIPALN
jgi:hypothetical protein